jgi:hypothetical protein
MQGGKNWFLPKEMNENRFFWDSHWLEIWSNHFYPSMGPNGGSVAMDSGLSYSWQEFTAWVMHDTSGLFLVSQALSDCLQLYLQYCKIE